MKSVQMNQSSLVILRFVIDIGMIASIINVISDVIMKKDIIFIAVGIIVSSICFLLFVLRSQWMNDGRRVTIVFIIFSLLLYPAVWMKSHGAQGSVILYAIFLLSLLTYVLNGFWGKFIPLAFIGITTSLIIYEYFVPSAIANFTSEKEIVQNTIFNYFAISMLMFALIYMIRKHFESVQQQLLLLANTDDLTKVYNRRYLVEHLEKCINKSKRYDTDFSLIFIDINKFKSINDLYGHITGDHVLTLVGASITESIRNYDTGARYGGDEFVILLPEATVSAAEIIVERIRIKLREKTNNLFAEPVNIAAGIIAGKDKSLEEILAEADEKMYIDKRCSEI